MARADGIAGSRNGRGLIVAWAIVVSGCTMCPDPYDYSGPVPNGSAPQNEFRARSNGILPIGAAPVPWPSVVTNGPTGPTGERVVRRHGTPTLADDTVTAASAEASVERSEATSVLVAAAVTEVEAAPLDATPRPDPWAVVPDFRDSQAATASAEEERSGDSPSEAPVAVPAPLAETPGWRPRTSR